MGYDHDVGAFDRRAGAYDTGRLGRLHHDIADKVAGIALALNPAPETVLDVGCGTGYLLGQLAARLPEALRLSGIDPAPQMLAVAKAAALDKRLTFEKGTAEELAFPDGAFELVVSTTSFDHWADQAAGIGEVARVLSPGGHLVLADLLSILMAPTMLIGHRGRVRTVAKLRALFEQAGLQVLGRHNLYVVVQALSARK